MLKAETISKLERSGIKRNAHNAAVHDAFARHMRGYIYGTEDGVVATTSR